jgi:hypothetical protein
VRVKLKMSEDPRKLKMPGMLNVCHEKSQAISGVSPRERPHGLQRARPQQWIFPGPSALTSCHHVLWMWDMELQDLMFALLGFGL